MSTRLHAGTHEDATEQCRERSERRTEDKRHVIAAVQRSRFVDVRGGQRARARVRETREDREPERTAHHERRVDQDRKSVV